MKEYKGYIKLIDSVPAYCVQYHKISKNKKFMNKHLEFYQRKAGQKACVRNVYHNWYINKDYVKLPDEKFSYYYGAKKVGLFDFAEYDVHWPTSDRPTPKEENILLSLNPSFSYTLDKYKKLLKDFDRNLYIEGLFNLYELWLIHPECEFVIMSGFIELVFCPKIYELSKKNCIEFLRYLKENKSELDVYSKYNTLLQVYKIRPKKSEIKLYNEYLRYCGTRKSYKNFLYFSKQSRKLNITIYQALHLYNDYYDLAKYCGKNMKDPYHKYPSNLRLKHDYVSSLAERIRAQKRFDYEKKRRNEEIQRLVENAENTPLLSSYCKDNNINFNRYGYYRYMLNNLKFTVFSSYYKTPKNFEKAFSKVKEAYDKEINDPIAVKEESYFKTIQKYLVSNKTDFNGYEIFIPENISDISYQAEILHQCLISMDYPAKVIKSSCVLVFIRKNGVPLATAEIKENKQIGQFYLDEHLPDYKPSEEMKNTFSQWLTQSNIEIKKAA